MATGPTTGPTGTPTPDTGTSSRDRFFTSARDRDAKISNVLNKILKEIKKQNMGEAYKSMYEETMESMKTSIETIEAHYQKELKKTLTFLGMVFKDLPLDLQHQLKDIAKLNNKELQNLFETISNTALDESHVKSKSFKKVIDDFSEMVKAQKESIEELKTINSLLEASSKYEELLAKGVGKLTGDNKFIDKIIRKYTQTQTKKAINKKYRESGKTEPFKKDDLKMFKIKESLNAFTKAVGGLGNVFKVAGLGLVALIAKAFYDRNKEFRKTAVDFSKSMGIYDETVYVDRAQELLKTSADLSRDYMNMKFIEVEQIGKQLQSFAENARLSGDIFSEGASDLLRTGTKLAEVYGIQLDYSRLNNEYNNDLISANRDLIKLFGKSNKLGLNFKKTMGDVAELGDDIRLYFKKGTIEAANFVTKLQSSGTQLKTIKGLMDKTFDYGESLKFANDINRITGKSIITSQEILEAYEAGPEGILDMQQNIIRQMGDFNKLSRRQQQIIASTMGMSIKEITDIKDIQKISDNISDDFKMAFNKALLTDKNFEVNLKDMLNTDLTEANKFGPEMLSMLSHVAGGTDKLRGIMEMSSKTEDEKRKRDDKIKELIDNVSKLTKEQIDEIGVSATFEDQVLAFFKRALDYLADLVMIGGAFSYTSADYEKDLKEYTDKLAKLNDPTRTVWQNIGIQDDLNNLKSNIREFEEKRGIETRLPPDKSETKMAEGGKLTRPTNIKAGERGTEYFAPKRSFEKLLNHEYGIDVNSNKAWVNTLVESLKNERGSQDTPEWVNQMLTELKNISKSIQETTIVTKVLLDGKEVAQSVNKINNHNFATGNG